MRSRVSWSESELSSVWSSSLSIYAGVFNLPAPLSLWLRCPEREKLGRAFLPHAIGWLLDCV